MKLTPKQEAYLSRFLRDVNMHLGAGVADSVREHGLKSVQQDIYRRLERVQDDHDVVSDDALFQILREMGNPEALARNIQAHSAPPTKAAKTSPSPGTKAASPHPPVWLGVCAWAADQLDQPPRLLRLVVFLAALVTGPLALIAYLVCFAVLYNNGRLHLPEKVHIWALLGRVAGYNSVILLLHIGIALLLRLIYAAYESLLRQAPPERFDWGWLEVWQGTLLFWMLAFGIPLSLLGGLPLANGWDHSLRRFLQALIALYAILLCFGVASLLVGLLLDSVEEIRPLIG